MIPKYNEIEIPALKELQTGNVMRAKDLREPLAKFFQLTEEELLARHPSGNIEIFLDRILWALSYLFISGLVEKPQRGNYKISEKGLSMLSSCTDEEITEFVKVKVSARRSQKATSHKQTNSSSEMKEEGELTPEEGLSDSYDRIKKNIQSQILATILSIHKNLNVWLSSYFRLWDMVEKSRTQVSLRSYQMTVVLMGLSKKIY